MGLMLLTLVASAQNPLFKSGFEGNTTLEAIPSSATSDDYQHFSGADSTTGYTWPMNVWGSYAVTTGMHPITGGSNVVSNYINNYIETVTGHTGSSTRALRMNITGPTPGFCCVQSTFQVAGMTQPVTDFYTRYWVKLNPELLAQVQANKGNFWRTLFELKLTQTTGLLLLSLATATVCLLGVSLSITIRMELCRHARRARVGRPITALLPFRRINGSWWSTICIAAPETTDGSSGLSTDRLWWTIMAPPLVQTRKTPTSLPC